MVASEDVLHDSWHLRRLIGRHAAAYGHAYGQTSPHAEDRMRRRQLREGVYEERPAVILGDLVAVGAVHQFQPVTQEVITADEIAPHTDGPAGGRHINGKC